MKILHVCKKYPGALGGDATVVANLQKQQQEAGHSVAIVTSNCDQIADAAYLHKVGFKDTPAGLDTITPKRIGSLVRLLFRMFAILRLEQPDLIHTHSIDMAFAVSFAARWYNIPVVHTFHIVTFYDANQSALRRKSELWLAKRARPGSITAPNMYDVRQLQSAGLEQTVLLPNGVNLADWESRGHIEKNENFTFLAVGRLERQKGYDYLIKASALLARTLGTAFRVVIVGEGSQMTALGKLTHALHAENIVSLVGRKDQKEIHQLLLGADAAVFSSLYETTPLTLLEAWAAAVPVIITPVGIVRDAPAGFGAAYVVPAKDEHRLMRAMNCCMADVESRSQIAAKGYEEAKKYVWPRVANIAEMIYRNAL